MAYPQLRASITSSFTDTDNSSVSATHPTGLTAGDLMIFYVAIFNVGADRTVTTPSGWTVQDSYTFSDRRTVIVYKKIATGGDVSAGSTSVSFSGSVDKFGYAMFAVTGAASGSEITLSENDDVTPAGVTTATGTTALTPIVPESLVFSAFFLTDLDLAATLTASSFSLTPSITMTERVDVGVRDGASDGCSLMIATGEYSGLSQITSRSVTFSESINGQSSSLVLIVNAPLNASGTTALHSADADFFAPTATNGATGTTALHQADADLYAPTAMGTSPSQWAGENKPSTTWTPESK